MRRLALVPLVLTAVLLSACGYKGPLYLPTNPPAKHKSGPTAAPATPARPAAPQTEPVTPDQLPEDQ
ncbi:putative lipoprotein [Microvirgula sp. AG722]|uniref:LPS translocon maturation chaperone LptM n=1 Tax=Microvirgula sp. AG722 TaxID=2183901 RepID=UPI000DC2C261|nr:lipoprotein [Microvirgula sp. AG722]RAS20285.1 putative lipoprotein [Microvirgula sp. AG722]